MWYANLRKNTRLGTLLVKRRLITTSQLHAAVNMQRHRRGANLGDILVEQGWVTRNDIRRSLRRQARVRYVATLVAVLWAPLQPASAGSFPSASANAEHAAIVDEELYAATPQFKLHDPNHRSGKVSTSLSRAGQIAGRMMLKSWWKSYRATDDDLSARPASSKNTIKSRYQLRLSDDKVLVRAKFRF